jgi:exosortase/archaeosortase family protein
VNRLTADSHDRASGGEEQARHETPFQRLEGTRARVRFIVAFWSLTGLLLLAHHYPYTPGGLPDRLLRRYTELSAVAVGTLLRFVGDPVAVSGNAVGDTAKLEITRDCDGIELTVFICSAILAFPASLKERLLGIGAGLVAAAFLNIVRLSTLYVALVHWPKSFDFLHVELWQVISFVLAMALFGVWARLLSRTKSRVGAPTPQVL